MRRRRALGVMAGCVMGAAGGAVLARETTPAGAAGLGGAGAATGARARATGTPVPAKPGTGKPATTASGRPGSAPDALPPNEVSLVPIPPGRVASAVSGLDGIARDLLARTGVPGMAIAVVHRGAVVYAKGFGVRRVGTAEPVNASTVFQLASVSKPVAATVVAAAVGRGVVSWDDRIVTHLPSFALADAYATEQVTVADMFCHRSGLPGHAGDLLEDLGYDQAEILGRLRYYPLTPFRARFAYTNFGLTAAAVAVAAAAGSSWEQLSQDTLYAPLRMTATTSSYATFKRQPNRADLHVRVDGRWEAKYTRDPQAQSPAGGVSSSVLDMATWMLLQLAGGTYRGRRVVAPDPLLTAHTPQITSAPAGRPSGRSGFYGLGFNVSYDASARTQLTHSGGFALGAATEQRLLPEQDLGIITLTNGMPIGLPESVNASFLDLLEAGEVTRDWLAAYGPRFAAMLKNPSVLAGRKPPVRPAPSLPAPAYTGTYRSSLYGTATVSPGRGGGLVLSLGPAPQRYDVSHWDGNVFSYFPRGENALGIAAVTFTIGPTGQASSADIENLNGDTPATVGLGRFTRA